MSETDQPYKCDVCGEPYHADAAGWLSSFRHSEIIQFAPGVVKNTAHLCGASCAMKYLSSWVHDHLNPTPN